MLHPTHTLRLTVAFFLFACKNGAPSGASEPPRADRVAELFFSTGVQGTIEPCGCTSKPLGGIQRLATVIGASQVPHGLIDAGALLLPAELDPSAREQHRLKAEIISRVYRQLGVLAINLADGDLAEGTELLEKLQGEGAVPLVSANIRPGAGGPSVAVSFLRELGGIKIGLTGVATPDSFATRKGVVALEYAPSVKAEVASLRQRGAEIVIVLASLDDQAAGELARAVPDIDVILRSPGAPITRPPNAPVSVGPVVVAEAGAQGQHIGRLTIRLEPGAIRRPIVFDDGGQRGQRQRELAARKIEALTREIEELAKRPDSEAAITPRREQIQRLRASLAEDAKAGPVRGSSLRIDLVPLSTDVVEHAEMKKVLDGYYASLREMNAEKGDVARCAAKPGAPTFIGTAKCSECHEEAYAFWKKTKHAKAWETLEKEGKHYDLTCVGCHTVGYLAPGGFCRLKEVGALKDVGCENCHGAGSKHAESKDASDITLTVTKETCAGHCHVPEHSDRFDFEHYLGQITGVGHERQKP